MANAEHVRGVPPGLPSGLVFFAVVLAGCGYIVLSKLRGFDAVYVTTIPVIIMVGYAALLGLSRLFRLRDDQSGDNLYYMGFLFTLTSLGVSLYQYSSRGSAEEIVQNFGVAIASTIAGIALRIFFNQMRRDPVEVEHVARLELAEAARKVKRELEGTVLEFGYFRRATQQSIADSLNEVQEMLIEAKDKFIGQLDDFARNSSAPLEDASNKSRETIEDLNNRISKSLEGIATKLAEDTSQLSKSTTSAAKSLDTIVSKLNTMQTPEQIIEIKLNPMIQGLSRAVNNFTKNAELQAKTVDANLRQTQHLVNAVTTLLTEMRADFARPVTATAPPARPAGPLTLPEQRQPVRTEPGSERKP